MSQRKRTPIAKKGKAQRKPALLLAGTPPKRSTPSATSREVALVKPVRDATSAEPDPELRLCRLLYSAVECVRKIPGDAIPLPDRAALARTLFAVERAVQERDLAWLRENKGVLTHAEKFLDGKNGARGWYAARPLDVVREIHARAQRTLEANDRRTDVDFVAKYIADVAVLWRAHLGIEITLGAPQSDWRKQIERECKLALHLSWDATALTRAFLRGWGVTKTKIENLTRRLDEQSTPRNRYF